MTITQVERGVLRMLQKAGGRRTFRPARSDALAYGAFDRDVVRTLYLLKSRALVSTDEAASSLIGMPGKEGRFAAITADLTEAGREALE